MCLKKSAKIIHSAYLSVFVFSVGRVIGPLVRFDSGMLQNSGKPVHSWPFLDVSLDAVVAFWRFRTGGRTPDQRDHLHSANVVTSVRASM